jgi:hypothetical protein
MKTTALLAFITAFIGLTVASPIVNQRQINLNPQYYVALLKDTQEVSTAMQTALDNYQEAAEIAVNENGGAEYNPDIYAYTADILQDGSVLLSELQNLINFLTQAGF